MKKYKDQNNKVHCLESTDFEYLLPEGCVRITEEEAYTLLAPTQEELAHQAVVAQELADIDDTKTDNRVTNLAAKTKAQVKKMADDIVTLDEAKDVIKTLLIIVRVLAKRL